MVRCFTALSMKMCADADRTVCMLKLVLTADIVAHPVIDLKFG